MKRLLYFLPIIFLFNSCIKPSIKNEKKIVIIFNKRTYKKDTLRIGDKSSFKQNPPISYIIEKKYLNNILTPKNIIKADTITIKSSKNIILNHQYHYYYNSTYFLKPGDTLFLNYIDDVPFGKLKNRKINFNIETKYNLSHKVYESGMEFFIKTGKFLTKKEKNIYTKLLLNNINKKFNYYDSLSIKKIIPNDIIYYLKKKLLYNYYGLIPFDSIINKDLIFSNDSLLALPIYRKFIKQFSLNKFKIKSIKSYNSTFRNYKSAYDSVQKSTIYSEKNKNYLLYEYLTQIIENFSVIDAQNYFNKFQKEIGDSILINNLKNTYLLDFNKLKKETKNVNFINIKKEQQSLSKITENNKGKLIYIDFWASWCKPCRAAMPASRRLHKDYKNKEVSFIYISIDKDFNKWEKASKEEKLTFYKNNLLSINYPIADFYKELKLNTIPRYLLYDKNGELVHPNAPSPEGKDIRVLLDKYLLKN